MAIRRFSNNILMYYLSVIVNPCFGIIFSGYIKKKLRFYCFFLRYDLDFLREIYLIALLILQKSLYS